MLTLFSEVARPLLPAEVDANFSGLDDRLRGIERDGVRSVGIKDIVASDIGGTVLITLTDGQTVGPLNLPTTFFVPRGAWVTGTAYRQRDYVTVGGSSYACRGPHTASADFATDLGNSLWQLNSAQGKDGEPFATFVGVYDAAKAYVPADMVLFDSGTGYLLYRLAFAAPAGTAPGTLQPGTPIPYWTLQSSPPATQTTEISQQGQGRPVPSSQQLRRRIARRTRFPVDFAGSYAVLSGGQATSAMSFDVLQNGQKVGAIAIPAASRTGTFSTVDRTNGPLLLPGDALVVILRTDLDGTASDLDLTLLGTVG